MEYPKELHENHNELPFLVEKMKTERGGLVPNLEDKKGYVVHIKALNQALRHGLKLKKLHRVKTMENIRYHKDMKLATSDKKHLRYVMKPNFGDG